MGTQVSLIIFILFIFHRHYWSIYWFCFISIRVPPYVRNSANPNFSFLFIPYFLPCRPYVSVMLAPVPPPGHDLRPSNTTPYSISYSKIIKLNKPKRTTAS
jgi:hypothetical protein